MPLRDLFCLLEAAEDQKNAALDQSLALARAYSAHASVLVAGPKAAAPYSLISTSLVGGLVKSENEKLRAQADKIVAGAQDALKKSGAAGSVEVCLEFFQDVVLAAKERALCSDLTVLGRPGGVVARSEVLFEEMLFGAGRPVLLAVPDRKPAEKIEKIVLAWDGSVHASRALSAALALFPVKSVDVLVVSGEKDLTGIVPATKVAAHIERHGAKASIVELRVDKDGVAATVDGHASKAGADLIVMGGFGRSRLREFVLGGVTRTLSQTARTPLLLVH
ncbi:MAG: universal stress protein [Bradyrhizobiaceae bacterium]|nr:universal stress protein [Bradyrhizobiaceae bacterium]